MFNTTFIFNTWKNLLKTSSTILAKKRYALRRFQLISNILGYWKQITKDIDLSDSKNLEMYFISCRKTVGKCP